MKNVDAITAKRRRLENKVNKQIIYQIIFKVLTAIYRNVLLLCRYYEMCCQINNNNNGLKSLGGL